MGVFQFKVSKIMLNLCYGSLQQYFNPPPKKNFEMRSCVIFQGARPVGMVLEDYIRWRDLDLTQICPFCLSEAVTVDLSPDSTSALSARGSEAAQRHGRSRGGGANN